MVDAFNAFAKKMQQRRLLATTFFAGEDARQTRAADDHTYDWAREDQRKALERHRHRHEESGDLDRQFLHAHGDETGASARTTWEERDQVRGEGGAGFNGE